MSLPAFGLMLRDDSRAPLGPSGLSPGSPSLAGFGLYRRADMITVTQAGIATRLKGPGEQSATIVELC